MSYEDALILTMIVSSFAWMLGDVTGYERGKRERKFKTRR